MGKTFKMAFGKGAYYAVFIGTMMELVLVIVMSLVKLYIGLLFLLMVILTLWFCSMSVRRSRYIVTEDEIIVALYADRKRKFCIDRISKINYVDTGTEWARNAPNARHQLAIYFDRKYLKSVEPRYFAPEDRNAFVEELLRHKPDITVNTEEEKL